MILGIINNLQKEISIFLISIIIATIIIVMSHSMWHSSLENKHTAESNLDFARNRYHTALDRRRLLLKFENKYNKLITSGIVGNEQRLNWVDTIESSTTKFKIPYLKYRIEKRMPVTSDHLRKIFPSIDVFKSIMTLEMQLLHEGDLFSIINHLDSTAKGLFDIQSCTISRNQNNLASLLESKTDRNFTSVCRLNWYTIKKTSLSTTDGPEI